MRALRMCRPAVGTSSSRFGCVFRVPCPVQSVHSSDSRYCGTEHRRAQQAGEPRIRLRETAVQILDREDTRELLSPEQYAALEATPFDAQELPVADVEALAHTERKAAVKQLRRGMLDDVERVVRRRHGANSKYIISKIEKSYASQQWKPRKKISRADMERLRLLHNEMPQKYNYDKLAVVFGVSRAAVGRIIRSKWTPSAEAQRRQAQQKNRVDVLGVSADNLPQHMLPTAAGPDTAPVNLPPAAITADAQITAQPLLRDLVIDPPGVTQRIDAHSNDTKRRQGSKAKKSRAPKHIREQRALDAQIAVQKGEERDAIEKRRAGYAHRMRAKSSARAKSRRPDGKTAGRRGGRHRRGRS